MESMDGLERAAARARSRRGESIAEVLVALLVSALAILMLASMTSASTRIIKNSQGKIDEFVTEENKLAEQSGTGVSANVSLTRELYKDGGVTVPVEYFVNTTGQQTIVSYKG